MKRFMHAAIVAAAVVGVATSVAAQTDYFGRNPVQWERMKFEILKTDHFDVYYYSEGRTAAEQSARLAERWYARLSKIFKYQLKDRQPLILYASQPQFQQTNTLGGAPGEGTGGVTEALKRRIVLPVGASLAETDHVIGHELVHAFQYAMTGQGRGNTNPGVMSMPLWFVEGMAEYLSIGPVDPNTAMWLREAAAEKDRKLPTISALGKSRYFPYRWGQALWAYLAGRFGDRIFRESLRDVTERSNDAERILKQVVGVDAKTLSKDWQAAIREAAARADQDKKDAADYGPALVVAKGQVGRKGQGGRMNVGPALSPDGARIAFMSERDLFSIELFVADAKTGRIVRRLSHTAIDPHVESLEFIASAGAWDRAGRRFVLAEVAKGRPLLVVLSGENGKVLREIPLPTLGEVATPSFSPDGKSLVFSALVNGFSDLYVYDLDANQLQRLTDDEYADVQPVWSPDGTRIAFATDRFTTRLDTLETGDLRLATLDLATHEIAPLPSFPGGKNINPQWSQQGDSLYFVSDASGISNIYRLDLASGRPFRITDVRSGVSGITPNSPTLSVAAQSGRLAYSVYQDDRYEIYAIDDVAQLFGTEVPLDASPEAAVIPGGKPEGQVLAARADATSGLADPKSFRHVPYRPSLGLDYVGQPYAAAGFGGGTQAFAGGISMQFSDMLGEHTLSTIVQAQSVSGFNDFGGIVNYVNRQHRLNWGLEVGQSPYVSRAFASGVVQNPDGSLNFANEVLTQREIDRSAAGLAFYPLDDAMRFETQVGFRQISFDSRLDTDLFDPSGLFLGTQMQDLPAPDSLHMTFASVAFVRDTSVFGATSPIMGHRLRLEATPVRGSVNYTGLLADVRDYVMPVRPVTIAARLLHYGRYGAGSDDPRMFPLFLGDPGLVRGYRSDSFESSECGTGINGSCPVFDQLVGSRVLIGNLEVRAPLFALFGAKNLYGPIPIEVGAFFDAGVAWDTQTRPAMFGGTRDIVRSVGLTGRLNLFGFAVLEADWARPLDRPGRSGVFQFDLLSGF